MPLNHSKTMRRSRFALFFGILFMGYMMTPMVIHMIDKDVEICMLMDVNEEEEKKGNESIKDIENKILSQINNPDFQYTEDWSKSTNTQLHLNSSEFLEQCSPPPERL